MRQPIHDNILGAERDHIVPDWSVGSTQEGYIEGKPTIPEAQIQADWNQGSTASADYIKNKPDIPADQIQSDWNQGSTASADYIKNKPTILTTNNVIGVEMSLN